MKKSKFLILLVTLTFPVILYLFLRSYGENEFALPVFFENGEKKLCTDSTVNTGLINVLDASLQDTLELDKVYQADYKVILFPNPKDSEIQTLKNELNRVLNTFDDLSLSILSFNSLDSMKGTEGIEYSFMSTDRSMTYFYEDRNQNKFVNCVYAFPTAEWNQKHPCEATIAIDHTLVLLDVENRIRGYYDGYETKDVDRLILEIRVLLSNR